MGGDNEDFTKKVPTSFFVSRNNLRYNRGPLCKSVRNSPHDLPCYISRFWKETTLDAAGILVRVDSRERKLIVAWSFVMLSAALPFFLSLFFCVVSEPPPLSQIFYNIFVPSFLRTDWLFSSRNKRKHERLQAFVVCRVSEKKEQLTCW